MLGALAYTCEEMQQLAATFGRLSQKKDKKAATRASAAQQSASWSSQAQACLAARNAPPVVTPPVNTGGGSPPLVPPVYIPPSTYQPPTILPTGGGGGGGGIPYYSVGGEFGPVFTPLDEILGTGEMEDSAGGGVPVAMPPMQMVSQVPGPVAPVVAAGSGDECSYAGQLPLQYEDEFGPMIVAQIVCADAGAAQGPQGGGAFDAGIGPVGPIEESEIATMDEGLSGLDFLGVARHLG